MHCRNSTTMCSLKGSSRRHRSRTQVPKLKGNLSLCLQSGFCLNITFFFNLFSSDYNRAESVCLWFCVYILEWRFFWLFVCLLSSRSSSLLFLFGVLDWIWAFPCSFFFGALILFLSNLLLVKNANKSWIEKVVVLFLEYANFYVLSTFLVVLFWK